jgi:small subunit ribosomal protein S16
MLSYRGILFKKHLQVGVIKGALTQDQADSKLADWKNAKEAQIATKTDSVAKAKADAKKKRLAAETKIKEARAEAIKKKAEAAKAPEAAPAAEGEAPAEAAAE